MDKTIKGSSKLTLNTLMHRSMVLWKKRRSANEGTLRNIAEFYSSCVCACTLVQCTLCELWFNFRVKGVRHTVCVLCQLPCDSSSTCTLCTCDDGKTREGSGGWSTYIVPASSQAIDGFAGFPKCTSPHEFIHTPFETWFQTSGSQMNWGLLSSLTM